MNVKQADAFFLVAQQSEKQALKIITHLADTGASRTELFQKGDAVKLPQRLSYRLTVIAGDLHLIESLGWGVDTLKSLDGLRKVLDGNAAKEMDILIGRLSRGIGKEWDAAEKKEVAPAQSILIPTAFISWTRYEPTERFSGSQRRLSRAKSGPQRQEITSLEDF